MRTLLALALVFLCSSTTSSAVHKNAEVTRVFIFAGQSNMVGSDSKVADIKRFPPFAGLEQPQKRVKFSYTIGRENKKHSDGWVELQAVDGVVGPELSFARKVSENIDAPIAIIKCAAGGTHLGGDWNPDKPIGFEMYPLALNLIRTSLAGLKKRGIQYRIEGFMWHQGENDMFEAEYQENYGLNLRNFVAKLRRDLETPDLRFYIGELCTKTIWGMDLRPRMYAIRQGQELVTKTDPLADYVRTSHVGVEIGGGAGLHYHYGTLGQLEHGVNYADAYLANLGIREDPRPALAKWPHKKGETIQLFVLAGHRNMEGERAFTQDLGSVRGGKDLLKDEARVPYKYSIGGGYKLSNGWEALGPSGYYDTFGPELSFGQTLQKKLRKPLAIAKFTHSGSQIIDWTPAGSETKDRNLYPRFLNFVRESVAELEAKGHSVELAGIFYHVGENDMSFNPYRKDAANRIQSFVQASREDLGLPALRWFVSQQPPTDHEQVNQVDVTTEIANIADMDEHFIHIKAFSLPEQEKKLVLDTSAIVQLGEQLAKVYLKQK
ncbi:MAG: hypothetical protein ACI9F9_000688 [Candidatus Paceibacteria bacterium]|jgi:hypothetical protein